MKDIGILILLFPIFIMACKKEDESANCNEKAKNYKTDIGFSHSIGRHKGFYTDTIIYRQQNFSVDYDVWNLNENSHPTTFVEPGIIVNSFWNIKSNLNDGIIYNPSDLNKQGIEIKLLKHQIINFDLEITLRTKPSCISNEVIKQIISKQLVVLPDTVQHYPFEGTYIGNNFGYGEDTSKFEIKIINWGKDPSVPFGGIRIYNIPKGCSNSVTPQTYAPEIIPDYKFFIATNDTNLNKCNIAPDTLTGTLITPNPDNWDIRIIYYIKNKQSNQIERKWFLGRRK